MTTANPENQPPPIQALSDTKNDLLTIVEFIRNRQHKKNQLNQTQDLANRNSLSKNKIFKLKNNKENNKKSEANQALDKLFLVLAEQLDAGHTVYHLTRLLPRHQDYFAQWQAAGWLTDITLKPESDRLNGVNTPIVMQHLPITEAGLHNGCCLFWLQRQWQAEAQLAQKLQQLAQRPVADLSVALASMTANDTMPLNKQPNPEQQQAIDKASRYAFSIITGGPGTGKTFTVAQLVNRLQSEHDIKRQQDPNLPPLSIALTAPTGKAAQRMQASLSQGLGEASQASIENAKTLHRLLGIGQGSQPKYHANNPLPDDLIIVDEASMLGLELAGLLVDAIKPTARLILLGDANQLAAVDAGSVLADLCQVPALQPYRTELQQSVRFDSQSLVGRFATALQLPIATPAQCQAKLRQVHQLLAMQPTLEPMLAQTERLPFYPIRQTTPFDKVYQTLASGYDKFFALMLAWHQNLPDIHDSEIRKQLFATFDRYRILTAGHQGKLGAQQLNKMMTKVYFSHKVHPKSSGFFYHGLPIMITHNDYALGLFNGDIGICLAVGGELVVCFAEQTISTQRLSLESCEPAYAMTIHKSQGSEFDDVAICLDRQHARLLSQELIYTAVTRSRKALSVVSSPALFDRAILQKGNRQTGLAQQFR